MGKPLSINQLAEIVRELEAQLHTGKLPTGAVE
jgi:hypothetical protein